MGCVFRVNFETMGKKLKKIRRFYETNGLREGQAISKAPEKKLTKVHPWKIPLGLGKEWDSW